MLLPQQGESQVLGVEVNGLFNVPHPVVEWLTPVNMANALLLRLSMARPESMRDSLARLGNVTGEHASFVQTRPAECRRNEWELRG